MNCTHSTTLWSSLQNNVKFLLKASFAQRSFFFWLCAPRLISVQNIILSWYSCLGLGPVVGGRRVSYWGSESDSRGSLSSVSLSSSDLVGGTIPSLPKTTKRDRILIRIVAQPSLNLSLGLPYNTHPLSTCALCTTTPATFFFFSFQLFLNFKIFTSHKSCVVGQAVKFN